MPNYKIYFPDYHVLPPNQQLHEATRNGDNAHVQMLFQQGGVDVNFVGERGNTALHIAVQYGYPEVMRTLLENGAKVNVFNSLGISPIMHALWRADHEAVDILKQAGVDVLAALLVVTGCGGLKTDFDLLSKEYVENIDFSAAVPRHTATMGLVLSSMWFDSPFDGYDGLESLMDSVCSHLHALGLAQAGLIGVDEAAAGLIG